MFYFNDDLKEFLINHSSDYINTPFFDNFLETIYCYLDSDYNPENTWRYTAYITTIEGKKFNDIYYFYFSNEGVIVHYREERIFDTVKMNRIGVIKENSIKEFSIDFYEIPKISYE